MAWHWPAPLNCSGSPGRADRLPVPSCDGHRIQCDSAPSRTAPKNAGSAWAWCIGRVSADPRPLSGSELARSSLLRSAARPYCRESGSSRRRARAAWSVRSCTVHRATIPSSRERRQIGPAGCSGCRWCRWLSVAGAVKKKVCPCRHLHQLEQPAIPRPSGDFRDDPGFDARPSTGNDLTGCPMSVRCARIADRRSVLVADAGATVKRPLFRCLKCCLGRRKDNGLAPCES